MSTKKKGRENVFKFQRTSKLAATCVWSGAQSFVSVADARVMLDVAALAKNDPNLYRQVATDFERGYRTSKDELLTRVENAFMRDQHANWEMSYLGKGVLDVWAPDPRALHQLENDAKALRELMQSKVVIDLWRDRLRIESSTSSEAKVNKRGLERKVPVIDHQFQQMRPLVLPVIAASRELRTSVCDLWKQQPYLQLDWEKHHV